MTSPLPTDEDARGLLAAIDDISDGLEHYEPTDHARRSVRSLRIVLDAARRSVVSTPSEDVRALIDASEAMTADEVHDHPFARAAFT